MNSNNRAYRRARLKHQRKESNAFHGKLKANFDKDFYIARINKNYTFIKDMQKTTNKFDGLVERISKQTIEVITTATLSSCSNKQIINILHTTLAIVRYMRDEQ